MISGLSSADCWMKNCRMLKEQFPNVCEELRPHISPNPASPKYRKNIVGEESCFDTVLLER